MSKVLVTSYCDTSVAANGRSRRMAALLECLPPDAMLVEPGAPHPLRRTVALPRDMGRRKRGINWGIFNFFLPANASCVGRTVRAELPGILLLTSIWDYAALAKFRDIPMVLDAHNVDAVTIEEPYGYGHPFSRLVRARERHVVKRMRHIWVCSEVDRQLFISRYGILSERLSIAPNAARLPADLVRKPLAPELEKDLAGKTVLFFMAGKLDYRPNLDALEFMANRVLPRLESIRPGGFILLVTGAPAPAKSYHPAIRFLGRVPRVEEVILRADICLAPIFSGSGTRLKILEYMAHARPVVATAKAAEGLKCMSGEDMMIVPAEEFSETILRLANEPVLAARIGASGRECVRRRYTWEQTQAVWRADLGRLLTEI